MCNIVKSRVNNSTSSRTYTQEAKYKASKITHAWHNDASLSKVSANIMSFDLDLIFMIQ
jgi:hypothetical protein